MVSDMLDRIYFNDSRNASLDDLKKAISDLETLEEIIKKELRQVKLLEEEAR